MQTLITSLYKGHPHPTNQPHNQNCGITTRPEAKTRNDEKRNYYGMNFRDELCVKRGRNGILLNTSFDPQFPSFHERRGGDGWMMAEYI